MAPVIDTDTWIPMAEAARMAGVPYQRFKRRMFALDKSRGARILKRFSGTQNARIYVSAEALRLELKTDPDRRDQQIDNMKAEITELHGKLKAERRARLAFQAKANAWFRQR